MHITILIPHFRTKELSAYTIYQFLKNKGKHEVDIIVIDNSYPHESIKGLEPFKDQITIINNESKGIQSHGVAFDMAIPHVKTDYFICAESDSFPLREDWLDYYETASGNGFVWGGSALNLSGGGFIHPTGSFYKTALWHEAKKYCDEIQYHYFPNMSRHTDFDCHLMVHNRIIDEFLESPSKYVELTKGYKELSQDQMLEREEYYSQMINPFHNGMGNLQENLQTYGQRNIASESPHVLLNNKENFINRIGYEPGQWLSYWLVATGRNGAVIPTEIKWMRNRAFQQQEYTINEAGFCHVWCGSSFYGMEGGELNDVYEFKKNQVAELYDSMPSVFKV